jgi:hypothetical protein
VKLLPVLARRRTVWLPTIWGWLGLLLVGAAALVVVARGLYSFLALNAPVGARVLVIEGWMDREGFDQALAAFRNGGYERAVVTGAPFERWPRSEGYASAAERGADYLRARGLLEPMVAAVPSPASRTNRTFLSAVAVRDWARRSGLELGAIDVFSQGAHARRSRLLFQEAFGPGVRVGILAARAPGDDEWWRTVRGTREVLDQAVALAWTRLFFSPPRTLTQAPE